jgi:hypothetical protein
MYEEGVISTAPSCGRQRAAQRRGLGSERDAFYGRVVRRQKGVAMAQRVVVSRWCADERASPDRGASARARVLLEVSDGAAGQSSAASSANGARAQAGTRPCPEVVSEVVGDLRYDVCLGSGGIERGREWPVSTRTVQSRLDGDQIGGRSEAADLHGAKKPRSGARTRPEKVTDFLVPGM